MSGNETTTAVYAWQFSASYLLSVSATRSAEGTGPDIASSLAAKQQNLAQIKRAVNAGQWANALSLSIDREALSNTQTIQGIRQQGFVTEVESISGMAANSIVELYQEGLDGAAPINSTAIVDRVEC